MMTLLFAETGTPHSREIIFRPRLNEYLDRNELCVTWNHPLANKLNTYVNHNLNHESCIDHIVVSSNVFNNIFSNDVPETPVNPSAHCPVTLAFSTTYILYDSHMYDIGRIRLGNFVEHFQFVEHISYSTGTSRNSVEHKRCQEKYS